MYAVICLNKVVHYFYLHFNSLLILHLNENVVCYFDQLLFEIIQYVGEENK